MDVDPGREWLSDDVVRLSLPYPEGFVNVFLVIGDDGVSLIDAGHRDPRSRAELLRHLRTLDIDVSDIRRVLLTHAHGDHVGLVAELVDRANPDVFVHRLEADEGRRAADRVDYRWLVSQGLPSRLVTPVSPPRPLPPRMLRVDGTEVLQLGPLRLELIPTPGHSPGMLCGYERSRKWLFSSDQLLRTATPVWLLAPRDDDPVGDYLAGLDTLGGYDVVRVLPGHGKAFGEFGTHLARASAAHVEVVRRISDRLERRPYRALALAQDVGLMPADTSGWSGTEVSHVLGRTLAYLRHLERQGTAVFDPSGGMWTAAAPG
jgi:glyoxylase-like metal-dependent hydrolase (beta-lactamase superfamily II)